MIRFNCPTCQRPYELPDALAALPLVCKQCGQRITPPAPTPDPPPPPPIAKPAPAKPAPAKPQAAVPTKTAEIPKPVVAPVKLTARPVEVEDDDVLVSKPDETPDIDFNIGGPTAASLSDAARARQSSAEAARSAAMPSELPGEINLDLLGLPPAPPPPPVPPPAPVAPSPASAVSGVVAAPPEPTVLPFLADLGVFLLLLFVGLLLGELAVRKPMGQVFTEAGSAAKFPPIDLLLLLAPPATFGLIYLLLNSREKTVGAWLRRRHSP